MSYNSGTNKKIYSGCNGKMESGSTFSQNAREEILINFLGLTCQKRRRDFVVSHAERKPVEKHRIRQPVNVIKRKHTLVYRLPQEIGQQRKESKTCFFNTLAISESVVKYNLSNKTGCTITPPKPRKALNKTSQEKKQH